MGKTADNGYLTLLSHREGEGGPRVVTLSLRQHLDEPADGGAGIDSTSPSLTAQQAQTLCNAARQGLGSLNQTVSSGGCGTPFRTWWLHADRTRLDENGDTFAQVILADLADLYW